MTQISGNVHALLKGGVVEGMRGHFDVESIPIRWTSAAAIMQRERWAKVLRQRNCWIHPDCSSAHPNVVVHAPTECPSLTRLIDLINQTIEISTVHIPPSLLHLFSHISSLVLGLPRERPEVGLVPLAAWNLKTYLDCIAFWPVH